MRRFLLPAVALGFSMLPLASASASANMTGAQALTSAVEPSANVGKVYWRYGYRHGPYWHRYGYWRGPGWHRYGYWHGPYGHRYGYWGGPGWHRYGYHRPYWRG